MIPAKIKKNRVVLREAFRFFSEFPVRLCTNKSRANREMPILDLWLFMVLAFLLREASGRLPGWGITVAAEVDVW